jgi:hypothetical protein
MKLGSKWFVGIVICTFVLSFLCTIGLWFQTNGFPGLSSSDITDIANTKLTVDATLFGLSTLSGTIFLGVVKNREKPHHRLTSALVSLMGISFLSFILALIWDFQCLGDPNNKFSLIFSMGLTISGALSGSFYLVWTFASYLESEKAEKATLKPTKGQQNQE